MKNLTAFISESAVYGNSEEINKTCQDYLSELDKINKKYIPKLGEFIQLKHAKRASHDKKIDTDYLPDPENIFNIIQAGLTTVAKAARLMDLMEHLVYDTLYTYKESDGLKETLQRLKEIEKKYSKKEKEIEKEN